MAQQAERYLKQATTRNRRPIGTSSIASYSSYIRQWIVPELGHLKLSEVKPSVVKNLVQTMIEKGLAPATINPVIGLVKKIVKSAVNAEGEPLYPRLWDNAFMDVPPVDKADQIAPILPLETLQKALQTTIGQDKVLYIILAASGARISELRALKAKPEVGTDSYWCPDRSVIFIRSTFAREVYQCWPKTDAGVREIDIHPDVNEYLKQADLPKSGWLFRARKNSKDHYQQCSADRHLKENDITTGFHSFRRFRITQLEMQGVPRGLQMFWTGHAARDVHESYMKFKDATDIRKEWARKAGLGFTL